MRFMDIPPFPHAIEIPDFDFFVRSRLSQEIVLRPEQAIPLLGYMGWPNDPEGRAEAERIVYSWQDGALVMPRRLRWIQTAWGRVADVFRRHNDLVSGDHQRRRAGPSIAKSIDLAAADAAGRGLKPANLWTNWKSHKDVAHLVTAATVVWNHACTLANIKSLKSDPDWPRVRPFGEFGLEAGQFQPFLTTALMPDFVIAAALWWQFHGLSHVPHSRSEPVLDPATIWRIPENINVALVEPPRRTLRPEALMVLSKRRAHNYSKTDKRMEETTQRPPPDPRMIMPK